MALPVRCLRCGSLSISGILIPPSISLKEFSLPETAEGSPSNCPLCKSTVNDDARRLADAIHAAVREAQLSRAEYDTLLKALINSYSMRDDHSQVTKVIDEEAPKAAGLKRFIPPGDVTGALALIIAILTFSNEFVFDWVAPALRESGRKKDGRHPEALKPSSWTRIRITEDILRVIPPESSYRTLHPHYTIKGSWRNKTRLGRLWISDINFRTRRISTRFLSEKPGEWTCAVALRTGPANQVWVLYVSPLDNPFRKYKLDMQTALQCEMLPFKLTRKSLEHPMDLSVSVVRIEEFIQRFNLVPRWWVR